MQDILKGLRVVEGSAFIAAPSGGMTLAQLGADVIRFDPCGGGLDYKRWPIDRNGRSLYWHSLNKGKRSIAVDFRKPEGQEILHRLITSPGEESGIFLTNFPARGWLADDRLRADRADLIYLNLTGDRHGGSALDYTVNCRVGLPFLNGTQASVKGDKPLNSPFPAWDVLAGQHIAIGLLAAERHRRISGEGQFIKLALEDVALATMGHLGYIAEATLNSMAREASGNHIFGTFGHDFACKDGRRVMIVGVSPNQWRSIVKVTGIAQSAAALEDSLGLDFSLESDRYRARVELEELIRPWFSEREFAVVERELSAESVCWGPYQTVKQLVEEDPECSTENPLFASVEQPGIGQYLVPHNPLYFETAQREDPMPAPSLGQHTDEILAETLGMSAGEIGLLHDSGIVAGE